MTGKAGVGKSFILAHICKELAKQSRVAVTCTTGIGCNNLPSELHPTTLHSFAGIRDGRGSAEYLVTQVKNNEGALLRWKNTEILVIDEISMLSAQLLEFLEYIARTIREDQRIFGGIQIISSGDFFQLPPVPNASDPGHYAFKSPIVKHPNIFTTRVYTRDEMKVLFALYTIPFVVKHDKEKLSDVLIKVIRQRESMAIANHPENREAGLITENQPPQEREAALTTENHLPREREAGLTTENQPLQERNETG